MRPNLFLLGLASATLFGAHQLQAQPDVREHRPPHERRPPPADAYPTEAPPPVREEHQAAKAGSVWVPGRWDWKAGKWEWLGGRWERERAGQRWNPGRWEHKGATWSWSEGGWVAGDAAPPHDGHEGDRDHDRDKDHDRDRDKDGRPHQAPPPPREEHEAARAGFFWIPGRWDWKANNWEWLPGRFERERAGKQWRAGRWEEQSGTWALVEGDWIDASAPPPPGDVPRHREWKLDRPTVSSYWPTKGKTGARVVIHGRNFPSDIIVMWGPDEVRGAKVRDDEIRFEVPATAQSATILLRHGKGRDLMVGNFEVANFDADAEAKRLDADRVSAAQAAWAASQARLAKDQAARQAALDADWQQREATREQRRAARAAEIRSKFQAAFLADPDTQSELTLHAQRVAELTRAKEVAQINANAKLGVRIDVATARENERHEHRMAALQAAFTTAGGVR